MTKMCKLFYANSLAGVSFDVTDADVEVCGSHLLNVWTYEKKAKK